MKYDIRTASYYELNKPSDGYKYSADYIDKDTQKLRSIGDQFRTEKEAIAAAKKFIEKRGEKGDRILSVYGNNYHYTGKNWRTDKPSN